MENKDREPKYLAARWLEIVNVSTYRRALFVLLAYFLLTLVLTYPLILHFTTQVAGDGSDDPALAWNLWWVRYALLDKGTNPIYTDYLFYPIGLNLGFYTLTYLNAFLSLPFQFTLGIISAANLNLILSFTLSGFGGYLLVEYLLGKDSVRIGADCAVPPRRSPILLAAFAAGLVYAFSANKFLYASLGQFNIASSQWIPFYILFLLKIFDADRPPLRYGFLLGLFLLAQALSEFIFASFLILFTIAYLLYWLATTRPSIRHLSFAFVIERLIRPLVLASVVFLVVMSPILAAMFSDLLREGDFIQQGLGFSNIFSADVLGFFVPSHLHPLLGSLEARFAFPYINFMYLGFTALVLAVIALWKVRPARVWGIWFALIALISLGPTLRINGAEIDLPMPFDLLLEIPLVKGNRYPSRWSVMLTLCLAVMVGYGVLWVLERVASRKLQVASPVRRILVPAVFCLLFLSESLSVPLPISNLESPEIYSSIAREAGNFSVMEIPLAWRNGFRVTGSYRSDSQGPIDRIFMYAQFFQTTQQHPILNGNTSRNPELKFQYFFEAPVLNSLIAIQTGHEVDDVTRARDRELAPRVLQFFGTRYIIWHTPFEEANREVANKTRAYLEEDFPVTKIHESYQDGRGVVVYRVKDAPTLRGTGTAANDSLVLKPNDPLARLYFGEGWGAVGGNEFWAQRKQAKLFLPLDAPRELVLTLDTVNAGYAREQGLNVEVNGTHVAAFNASVMNGGTIRAQLPANVLRAGMNEITFEFRETALPVQTRFQTPLVVRSAGEEQGAFGHIYVKGNDESPNARGYNVVVIDPERFGVVEARENFDTFASDQESERMANFIAQIPDGKIVGVAASDDASMHLTQAGAEALESLGANVDLRGKFRWSHALIARKGDPGSAREAASEIQVSQLIEGAGLIEPTAAVSIGEIRIEPAR